MSQTAEPLLRTEEDWTEMQLNRAYQKQLLEHFAEHGPPSPGSMTLSALLAAGAHLGHSTSLLNPNFIPYSYGARAGITIIDLDHTLPLLRRAANLVRAVAARGGTIVFVGSRPDIRPAARKAAERMGKGQGYYIGERWLPGMFTNRVDRFSPKVLDETKIIPDLMVFLNPLASMAAIRECAVEHVPTIGVIDSNVDPRIVMYAIPANDESVRTAELIAGVLSIAGREGVEIWAQKQKEVQKAQDERDDRAQARKAAEAEEAAREDARAAWLEQEEEEEEREARRRRRPGVGYSRAPR